MISKFYKLYRITKYALLKIKIKIENVNAKKKSFLKKYALSPGSIMGNTWVTKNFSDFNIF